MGVCLECLAVSFSVFVLVPNNEKCKKHLRVIVHLTLLRLPFTPSPSPQPLSVTQILQRASVFNLLESFSLSLSSSLSVCLFFLLYIFPTLAFSYTVLMNSSFPPLYVLMTSGKQALVCIAATLKISNCLVI